MIQLRARKQVGDDGPWQGHHPPIAVAGEGLCNRPAVQLQGPRQSDTDHDGSNFQGRVSWRMRARNSTTMKKTDDMVSVRRHGQGPFAPG